MDDPSVRRGVPARAGVRPTPFPANPTVGVTGADHTDRVALSVLVVDDDEGFLNVAKRILTSCGYRPDAEARSVSDALQQATRHKPDFALVDVGLPDGDGLELSRRLTAAPWHVPVVLVSADTDATSQQTATDAGALGFIPKHDLSCALLHTLISDG